MHVHDPVCYPWCLLTHGAGMLLVDHCQSRDYEAVHHKLARPCLDAVGAEGHENDVEVPCLAAQLTACHALATLI